MVATSWASSASLLTACHTWCSSSVKVNCRSAAPTRSALYIQLYATDRDIPCVCPVGLRCLFYTFYWDHNWYEFVRTEYGASVLSISICASLCARCLVRQCSDLSLCALSMVHRCCRYPCVQVCVHCVWCIGALNVRQCKLYDSSCTVCGASVLSMSVGTCCTSRCALCVVHRCSGCPLLQVICVCVHFIQCVDVR